MYDYIKNKENSINILKQLYEPYINKKLGIENDNQNNKFLNKPTINSIKNNYNNPVNKIIEELYNTPNILQELKHCNYIINGKDECIKDLLDVIIYKVYSKINNQPTNSNGGTRKKYKRKSRRIN